jgi:PAS domain S-box-containing protein
MKDQKDLTIPTYVKKQGMKKTWPAFLILLISLSLTVVGWNIVKEEIKVKLLSLFESENSKVISKLTDGIERQTEVLRSFQLLFKEYQVEVVRDVFELSAAVPIRIYDHIQSISYAPYIQKGGEGVFNEYVRNLGYNSYQIKPSGSRDEYFPIQYTVPYSKNMDAIGIDLLTKSRLKEAIEFACINDKINMTCLMPLICTKNQGFLLVAPIYKGGPQGGNINWRSSIRGICFIELRADDFIKPVLGSESESSTISYSIYDGSGKSGSSVIYSKPAQENPLLTKEQTLNVAGHDWIIDFSTSRGFGSNVNVNLPWLVLGGGVILSFLLFGFTFSLITSRGRAIDLAERITRSQRRIVDSSKELICVLGFDNKWKSVNPASKQLLGYDQDEMLQKSLLDFILVADHETVFNAIKNAPDEKSVSIEARFITKEGVKKWINWSITSSSIDQMVYMIGRDITEKKKSDEQIRVKNRQLDLARVITDRENYKNEEFLKEQSLNFRTQLTSIVGFLEIIMSEPVKLDENEQEFVGLAYQSAVNLMDSVKNVLDITYSRISDVSFIYQNFRISDIEGYLSILLKGILDNKGVIFRIEVPRDNNPVIYADPYKLIQALVTIIDNVLVFHKRGEFLLKSSSQTNLGFQEIKLIHTGINEIPSVFRPSVFMGKADIDQFTLNDTEFKVFIAKSLIDVMRGNILLAIEDNALTFTIKLPVED